MKLKCLECGDVIKSKYTHDFVECKCGSCFVDGGNEYFRYGAKDFDKIQIVKEETNESI